VNKTDNVCVIWGGSAVDIILLLERLRLLEEIRHEGIPLFVLGAGTPDSINGSSRLDVILRYIPRVDVLPLFKLDKYEMKAENGKTWSGSSFRAGKARTLGFQERPPLWRRNARKR